LQTDYRLTSSKVFSSSTVNLGGRPFTSDLTFPLNGESVEQLKSGNISAAVFEKNDRKKRLEK